MVAFPAGSDSDTRLKNEKVLQTKTDVEKEGGGRSFVLQKNSTAKV